MAKYRKRSFHGKKRGRSHGSHYARGSHRGGSKRLSKMITVPRGGIRM